MNLFTLRLFKVGLMLIANWAYFSHPKSFEYSYFLSKTDEILTLSKRFYEIAYFEIFWNSRTWIYPAPSTHLRPTPISERTHPKDSQPDPPQGKKKVNEESRRENKEKLVNDNFLIGFIKMYHIYKSFLCCYFSSNPAKFCGKVSNF